MYMMCNFQSSVSNGRSIDWSTSSRWARRRIVPTCAVKARWCLDIRYGAKMEAVELLQRWVRDVGSAAGLTTDNTAINSGSVGSPESRLELEVAFNTLAELEEFWASIPQEPHKAWSQQFQNIVVHGSPVWEIFRTVEAFPERDYNRKGAIPKDSPSRRESGSLVMASIDDVEQYGMSAEQSVPVPPSAQVTESGLAVVGNAEEAQVILDWKGEPMKINPGDKLPFQFQ